ncbi:MAG TPA: FkbM family methyltransferase [Stellaceae bacterium]|nr:FkbM family methyltransferase [Stellaceae bacterium]
MPESPLSNRKSFSQHGQDLFVYETFFKDRAEPGVFVDVGAYDGVTFSNTLLFERHGWRGICIEPLPSVFEKLKANRSAVCLNCAVSDRSGRAAFVEADMPGGYEKMYSGLRANFDEHHARLIREHGSNVRTYEIQVRTLREILEAHSARTVDYLSVDTEGSEWKILRDFDLVAFDVKVLSVENNTRDEKIRLHLAKRGFRQIHVFAGFDELYSR